MNIRTSTLILLGAATALNSSASMIALAASSECPTFSWSTVVNNNDRMPGAAEGRTFNSYNQPSVNEKGVVVIRARSRGGPPLGPATHGIYSRNMERAGKPIIRILDQTTKVPGPNNLGTKFTESPALPGIDIKSDTIATRGNHQPVWVYSGIQAGTTGIYTNPFGRLITGASKLGAVPEFAYFGVPGEPTGTIFDVFPGAPSVTNRATIVFKGNYTVSAGETGVFYRELERDPAKSIKPVMLIANTTFTRIPGSGQVFGSLSPPSAANRAVVFAGFDNEDNPRLGGIYRAPLRDQPRLQTLVRIGDRLPGEASGNTFKRLGEEVAFDGRYVGFWGAWGTQTRTKRLYCPTDGNKDRIDYCKRVLRCPGYDPGTTCDTTGCYQDKQVPVSQGIFVHDATGTNRTRIVAKTGALFDDFLFWSYSGKTPCVGSGGGDVEDDGEAVRWRSSAFVAVSGSYTAFKAVAGDVVGIYLGRPPDQAILPVLDTRTDGQAVDPEAPEGSTITDVGIQREGFRGRWLVVNAAMGIEGNDEESSMAGVYLTRVPK